MFEFLAIVALLASAPHVGTKECVHPPQITCHLMRWDDSSVVQSLAAVESEDGHIAWTEGDSSLDVSARFGRSNAKLECFFIINLKMHDARAQVSFEAPFQNRLLLVAKGNESLAAVCSAE